MWTKGQGALSRNIQGFALIYEQSFHGFYEQK